MSNKEEIKRKLIWAVGEVFKTKGFAGLKISRIARCAEVDRKYVYRYFEGGLNGLIEAYVTEHDYWMAFKDVLNEVAEENGGKNVRGLIVAILQNQFRYFYSEKDMQRLILLEITEDNQMMRSIHNAREAQGQRFLALADPYFEGTSIDIRGIAALLVSGIYYTVLHARFNGGMISDIDINTESGQDNILKALEQIVGWAFEGAQKEKSLKAGSNEAGEISDPTEG
ncbi:TetR/AcrR family transcriptional regulator [Mucilaginibacter polytrichastri]|uniref:Uncharacterized protein n=1 Tax=Mucilaginibacter polytrichastri TaxID=1302689 RepID=A0A1Q6A6M8_9SPHI|nr:TetR/AcrR family transcriptional regulator [Mucilaginibacter polytrichastri]OKS89649.1 hypothetical protein RG47T_5134 [Mucilaginibacter polytrichastri]SFT24754.1 transcriptional regulator, TetR family [Mucilaginibacter polytrichastri]